MTVKSVWLPALVILSACSGVFGGPARPQTAQEHAIHAFAIATSSLFVCDYVQTYQVSDGGKWDGPYTEGDPVLGSKPSVAWLTAVDLANVVSITALGYSRLPAWTRWALIGIIAARDLNTIHNNWRYEKNCGL